MEAWRKQIGNLLFDFGGTLDVPGAHWLDRFLRHYHAAGFLLTRDELDLAYSHATELGYRAGPRIHGYGLRQLLNELVKWQFEYLTDHLPQRIPAALIGCGDAIASRFYAETLDGYRHSRAALAALAPRFKIGVVSNFYGNLEAVLREGEMLPFVTAVIDSSRVGFFKPDPRIYEAALAALAARPEHTVMVGDSMAKDCAPARQLGIRTVWLMPAAVGYTAPIDMAADLTVQNLQQLVEFCLGSD